MNLINLSDEAACLDFSIFLNFFFVQIKKKKKSYISVAGSYILAADKQLTVLHAQCQTVLRTRSHKSSLNAGSHTCLLLLQFDERREGAREARRTLAVNLSTNLPPDRLRTFTNT